MISMTYGELPTFEQYNTAWDYIDAEGELRNDLFHFGNDKRLGHASLNKFELWDVLQQANREYEILNAGDSEEDPEVVGDWISSVLSCLGFEWV
jgi:hypothetical protein